MILINCFKRVWMIGVLTIALALFTASVHARPADSLNLAPFLDRTTDSGDWVIQDPLAINPAALHVLRSRSIGWHVHGAADANGENLHLVTYMEPDTGVGAGRFSAYQVADSGALVRGLAYSFSKPLGGVAFYGANMRYVIHSAAGKHARHMAADLGLNTRLSRDVEVGFLFKNALAYGRLLDNREPVKGGVIDVRLRTGPIVDVTGRIVDHDLTQSGDTTYQMGIEVHLANVWIGISQGINMNSSESFLQGGLSVSLSNFVIDWRVSEVQDDYKHLFGVSYRF